MVIKRYKPIFKKLARFKQPLFYEKRGKILRFNRYKWQSLKRLYFLKNYKFFKQDASTFKLCQSFFDDKVIRLKKTYKFLLQDKQKLQFYFGNGRLRYFNLKRLANNSLSLSLNKKTSSGSLFLFLLDNRLMNSLYRLSFVPTLLDAKRLISCNHVKIADSTVFSSTYALKKSDIVVLDPAIVYVLFIQYLRFNFPFFYFRRKRWCCARISKKITSFSHTFVDVNRDASLSHLKFGLETLKNLKT
jgi:ribosomal protein S4